MDMESLHHRNVHVHNEEDYDSESSDTEDEDDITFHKRQPEQFSDDDEEKVLVDPGPFRYHKKICAASLPCFLVTVGFAGELVLTIMTVGTVFLILMDRLGEKKRSVIIYAFFFVPCHFLIFVAVLPLVWLSFWNVFLIGAINTYVILTGGWMLLLFPCFRMEEPQLSAVIELLLFSLYPAICTLIITWVFTTITPVSLAPIIAMAIAFVLLQVYLLPTISSFKGKVTEDEDLNILQQSIVFVMTLVFCLSPPVLHIFISIVAPSTNSLFSSKSLIQLGFTISLGLFLTTLLSIRQLFEYSGYPYTIVTRGRWICGMLATVLCYPMLQQFRLSSHFLPWLPVAIVAFAVLGFFLGNRKYWIPAVCLLLGLASLLGFWMFVLPWHLTFYLLGNIHINLFYFILCAHFCVCLLCLYVASHGNRDLLGFLVSLQALLLTVGETSLYKLQLYSLSLCVLSALLATYLLQRLHHGDKLRLWAVLFSSSVHITKGVTCLLTELLLKDGLGLVNYAAIFLLVFAILQSFVYEPREAVPLNEAARNLVFLLVSLAINTFPVLSLLSYVLWQDTPSYTDLIGLWFVVGGVLVLLFAQVHSEVVSEVRVSGLLMLVVGGVILMLQPAVDFSLYSIFQWSEIGSLLVLLAILMTRFSCSIQILAAMAVCTAVCPSVRAVIMLYGEIPSVLHIPLYLVPSASVLTVLILYSKSDAILQSIDQPVIVSIVASSSSLLLICVLDLVFLDTKVTMTSLSVLKSMATTTVALSVLIKLLTVSRTPDYIPVATSKEEKAKPKLPLLSNVVTLCAFLLLCMQGPTEGFLHDMWCCGASIIFFCLQRDFHVLKNLKDHNRQTPTILASICFLNIASIYRSSLWHGTYSGIFWGVSECLLILPSLPVYYVLWGILWKNEIISENMVVFTTPLNSFMYLIGTTYSTWALATSGLFAGIWMMMVKLPMVPYGLQYSTS